MYNPPSPTSQLTQLEEVKYYMLPGALYKASEIAEQTEIDAQQVRKILRDLEGKCVVEGVKIGAYKAKAWRRLK